MVGFALMTKPARARGLISLLALAAALAAPHALAHPGDDDDDVPPYQEATAWPDRVVVNATADPATSFAVTWRPAASVGVAIAQIVPATADARIDLHPDLRTANARSTLIDVANIGGPQVDEPVITNHTLPPVHYHSVVFDDLEPDTLYAYRVRGRRGAWGPWTHVRTAPSPDANTPLQFVFFGDAQTGIRSHITRVFDTAADTAPHARFAIHGGDLVNTALYDAEWAEWFDANARRHARVPSMPVAGNHDYVNHEGIKLFAAADKAVSPLWRPQFTLPISEDLPEALHETVYAIRYGDVHVFVLDSSGEAWDQQMAWLDAGLETSDAPWTVVTMHHPLFSFVGGAEHPAARERRTALVEVLQRRKPDVVLTGHRHTYQRGEVGDDIARIAIGEPHAVDTVFVVTASSTKRGQTKLDGWERYEGETEGDFSLVRHADNTPLFAVIDIDGPTLTLRAIDAVGEVYDGFSVTKDEAGVKTVANAAEAQGETRSYDNTGPYRPWDDLR